MDEQLTYKLELFEGPLDLLLSLIAKNKMKIEDIQISIICDQYMEYIEDKTQFPIATKIINTLVFKNKVPTEYILKNIESSKNYYKNKPTHVLYGIRKLFWEKEFRA